jgi:hypothetical protein
MFSHGVKSRDDTAEKVFTIGGPYLQSQFLISRMADAQAESAHAHFSATIQHNEKASHIDSLSLEILQH